MIDLYPEGADHAERDIYARALAKVQRLLAVFETTADMDNAATELAHDTLLAWRAGFKAGEAAAMGSEYRD